MYFLFQLSGMFVVGLNRSPSDFAKINCDLNKSASFFVENERRGRVLPSPRIAMNFFFLTVRKTRSYTSTLGPSLRATMQHLFRCTLRDCKATRQLRLA